MPTNLIQEIAAKVAVLPPAQQQKALAYIEALTDENPQTSEASATRQSLFGLLPRRIETLEVDLAEVRREIWQNFPREEPQ